jgi:hypothetical protein
MEDEIIHYKPAITSCCLALIAGLIRTEGLAKTPAADNKTSIEMIQTYCVELVLELSPFAGKGGKEGLAGKYLRDITGVRISEQTSLGRVTDVLLRGGIKKGQHHSRACGGH